MVAALYRLLELAGAPAGAGELRRAATLTANFSGLRYLALTAVAFDQVQSSSTLTFE
jgi:hypothetical protein